MGIWTKAWSKGIKGVKAAHCGIVMEKWAVLDMITATYGWGKNMEHMHHQ